MTEFLRIKLDKADIQRADTLLGPGGKKALQSAYNRAANRAAVAARVVASKEVRSKFTISSARYRERMVVKKASKGRPAFLTVTGHRFPLTYFKYRAQRGQEAQVSVKKGRFTPQKGAFLGSSRSGPMLYRRRGKAAYPIRALTGPAAAQMVASGDTVQRMTERGQEVLEATFEHNVTRTLERLAR